MLHIHFILGKHKIACKQDLSEISAEPFGMQHVKTITSIDTFIHIFRPHQSKDMCIS